MKFATAIASVIAAANAFRLTTVSDSQDVNGKFLSPAHEGAGFSYLLLGEGGFDLEYNTTTKLVSFTVNDIPYSLGDWGDNTVAIGPAVEPKEVTFNSDNVLEFGEQLWACKNFPDPYRYTQHSYAVRYGASKPNEDCEAIQVKRV